MSFYNSPEEMYNARAARSKKDGDRHWAKAKKGEGAYHYGKAKICYQNAEEYKKMAEKVKGKKFGE